MLARKSRRHVRPHSRRQVTFLYWSEVGWAAQRDVIRQHYLTALARGLGRGPSWADFERHAAEHFAALNAQP